ncbi:MAG: glycosyltransferase family 4 protein [Desulfurococcaceae archaeon]
MKILFLDHPYHKITNSSNFFIDIMKRFGEIEFIYIDPHNFNDLNYIMNVNLSEYKLVVLWQLDYFAPFFLGKGIKCIVVPMYDASGSFDQIHWIAMNGSLVVCFCLHLYRLVAMAGNRCVYVKYFPEIIGEPSYIFKFNSNFDLHPSVFLWERRPDSKINAFNIINRVKGIKWLHIHQVPDPGFEPTDLNKIESNIKITTSNWFPDKVTYLKEISKHDFFIAPRYTEGIGLSFLEAMAMGIPVIASDLPTHNEYILNYKNGILINFFNDEMIIDLSDISIDKLNDFKQNTYYMSKNLRTLWIDYYEKLLIDSIKEYLEDYVHLTPFDYDLSYLSLAHIKPDEYYLYLKKNLRR